jgi:hypothetical protein
MRHVVHVVIVVYCSVTRRLLQCYTHVVIVVYCSVTHVVIVVYCKLQPLLICNCRLWVVTPRRILRLVALSNALRPLEIFVHRTPL